jgi:AcrR family transcriptional regulator
MPATTTSVDASAAGGEESATRPRDGARTRRALLGAAATLFAADGYAATTVRDIANEAGVNVSLINRYFTSKEGLFEACLTGALEQLAQEGAAGVKPDVAALLAGRLIGTDAAGHEWPILPLLLRSSGDERIDRMRFGVLRTFSERLAATAGRHPDQPGSDATLLRAQVLLATAIGLAVLRTSSGLEPLVSADRADLAEILQELLDTLLPQP